MKYLIKSVLFSFLIFQLLLIPTVFAQSSDVEDLENQEETSESEADIEFPIEVVEDTNIKNYKNPIIFVSKTCPYCQQLMEDLPTLELGELEYEIYEISETPNRQLYTSAATACKLDNASVPMLYFNEKCTIGLFETKTRLELIAVDADQSSNTTETEEVEDATSVEESSNSESTTDEESENENQSDNKENLSDQLNQEPPPTPSTIEAILVVAIPLSIFGLAYLFIQKLQL